MGQSPRKLLFTKNTWCKNNAKKTWNTVKSVIGKTNESGCWSTSQACNKQKLRGNRKRHCKWVSKNDNQNQKIKWRQYFFWQFDAKIYILSKCLAVKVTSLSVVFRKVTSLPKMVFLSRCSFEMFSLILLNFPQLLEQFVWLLILFCMAADTHPLIHLILTANKNRISCPWFCVNDEKNLLLLLLNQY